MSSFHRSDFLKEAKLLFPELRDELNRQYGLLHLEMHVFGDFVKRKIDDEDKDVVIKAFQFTERMLKEGNPDLVSAVAVSFLEHLDFDDGKISKGWAMDLMPSLVAKQYHAIIQHNRDVRSRNAT
jgi:hypothetical protein